MKSRRLKWLLGAVVLVTLYIGSYFFYRASHVEVWARDGQPYMIFPTESQIMYYVYRPLMYPDAALTGMRFHIGPHQE